MAGTNGLDWRLDIGRTRSLDIVGMSLLDHHVAALGPTLLAGIDILYINHLISDSLMVARGFKRLAAWADQHRHSLQRHLRPRAARRPRRLQAPRSHLPAPRLPPQPVPHGHVGGGPPRHCPAHSGPARWRTVDDRRGRRLRLPGPARRPHPPPAPGVVHWGGGAHPPREGQLPVPGDRRRAQAATPTPAPGGHDTIAGSRLKTAHEGGFEAFGRTCPSAAEPAQRVGPMRISQVDRHRPEMRGRANESPTGYLPESCLVSSRPRGVAVRGRRSRGML